METQGTLYIVATPIGNLEDISARAIAVLKQVDLIAAEDTRHSKRLLQHFAIATPLTSYHDFSSDSEVKKLLDELLIGRSLALISDAGTPLISDPGYRLVEMARSRGIAVIPVPGASAVIAALSVAGIPSDRFYFEGFLPAKSTQRCKRLAALAEETSTLVFYESPHRIIACLNDMAAVIAEPDKRKVFVARELTKKFESHFLGSVLEAASWIASDENNSRGEFVLVLEGRVAKLGSDIDELMRKAIDTAELLSAEVSMKRAVAVAARLVGVRKNALYAAMLEKEP
ncbi:MAG: 16S rRNA (cytidine(1402)-2'-O)-methyltransferase [Proteobacteria bacterium]|nr:16S rRNA (cytidine(1402)-2'-O)-methyltransferase [Pseudomonadota bacterium]MDA1243480.1 16S rRNA (cytidine(1402)-2'-O)-methyltransferase [Pseudomonadota bacterium]